MPNVPDDWGVYWTTCTCCGVRYHESEPHDCEDEEES